MTHGGPGWPKLTWRNFDDGIVKRAEDSVSLANVCGSGSALRCCVLVLKCEDSKRKFCNVAAWREREVLLEL